MIIEVIIVIKYYQDEKDKKVESYQQWYIARDLYLIKKDP